MEVRDPYLEGGGGPLSGNGEEEEGGGGGFQLVLGEVAYKVR